MNPERRKSLDEVLHEIEHGSKVEKAPENTAVQTLTDRLRQEGAAGPQPKLEGKLLTPTSAEILFGTKDPFTKRQHALPKINLSQMAGMVTVLFLVVGLGSATYLSLQEQDVRQQASDGRMAQYQDVVAQLNEQNTVDEALEKAQAEKEEVQSQRMFFGGVLILVGVL
jgi:uncharacterized protein HemX